MSKVTMWRSRWRCVIKPAYSVSFLLSINIFVWQNVLYFPKDLRIDVRWISGQNSNKIHVIYADIRNPFLTETCSLLRSPDSVVSIMTGWTVRGSNFGRGYIFYLLQNHPYRPWDPPILLFKGYRGLSRGVKRPGREVDYRSHLVSSLRMSGAIPLYAYTAWTGDKPDFLHAACWFYNKIRFFLAVLLFYSSSRRWTSFNGKSFGLLNDLFPFPSILDAGNPVFNLHLANILFHVILPSVLGSSLWSFG